jgi:hypothetical protein
MLVKSRKSGFPVDVRSYLYNRGRSLSGFTYFFRSRVSQYTHGYNSTQYGVSSVASISLFSIGTKLVASNQG